MRLAVEHRLGLARPGNAGWPSSHICFGVIIKFAIKFISIILLCRWTMVKAYHYNYSAGSCYTHKL